MPKHYNTHHRDHIIKTRMTEEEHADFMERLTAYGMNPSEFIRQAITSATVKPVASASCSKVSPCSTRKSFNRSEIVNLHCIFIPLFAVN